MKLLKLPKKTYKSYFINRSINTLSNGINLGLSKDVERAAELSILLYAVGDVKESISLIHSYAFDIEYSEISGAWIAKEVGLSLLSYHYNHEGDLENANEILMSIFSSNPNLDASDTDWIIDSVKDDLSDYVPKSKWPKELQNHKINAIRGHASTVAELVFPYLVAKILRNESRTVFDPIYHVISHELGELEHVLNDD